MGVTPDDMELGDRISQQSRVALPLGPVWVLS